MDRRSSLLILIAGLVVLFVMISFGPDFEKNSHIISGYGRVANTASKEVVSLDSGYTVDSIDLSQESESNYSTPEPNPNPPMWKRIIRRVLKL